VFINGQLLAPVSIYSYIIYVDLTVSNKIERNEKQSHHGQFLRSMLFKVKYCIKVKLSL
jgi:hypothetical protein